MKGTSTSNQNMLLVGWKSFAALCLIYFTICTKAQTMQDAISMTSDGWRPILGTSTRREPVYHDEILHYRNPSQTGGESIKAETYPPPTTTQAPTTTPQPPTKTPPQPSRMPIKPTLSLHAGKIPPHSKPPVSHYFALPNLGMHGPHIPLGSVTHGRPGQIGMIKKFPTPTKPFIHQMNHINGKRHIKPVRIQPTANSHRDEIFAASPSSGGYAFFKPGPSNIKTRETVGLGLPGGAHYSVSQPHAHIEFTNRFALPPASENIFSPFGNPLQGFIFPKHTQSNDINYQFQNHNDEYTRNLVPPPPLIYRDKNDIKAKDDSSVKPRPSSENVVLQVPPTFEFQRQKASTKAPVHVQVTKEKLNVFHNNVPSNYNGDYVDYDFHSVRSSNPPSNAQMYEVTEGKPWHDLPPQFSHRPRKPPLKKRPLEVQLNLPPFLPTPYRPEGQGIVPTSPTQSEVSTIFTKLSKLQKDKAEYTTLHPFTFDVKEVSTHYPILGKPSFDYETQTPYVMPIQEISNDITTRHQKEPDIITTPEPPIRHRPSRRRKPSHRLRITTTEAPTETDGSYMEDVSGSDSVEIERPVHRHRKPSRYRTTTLPSSTESDEVPAKTRGRNRYRTRPPANDLEQPLRKRIRPIKQEMFTEIPENHKMIEDSSTDITSGEDESASAEAEIQKDIEQELPGRHYIPEEDANKFEDIPKQSIDRSEEVITSTTERQPTTILHLPENEIDSPAKPITEQEEQTTITMTTEGTTTTPKRIRGRPIKYDNANRPRFSVKEFRQKLSTSTEPSSKVSTENPRIRFPNRLRRPLSSSTTAASPTEEDNNTEPARAKFVPKDPRHGSDTENDTITEKNVKSVNSRLRPFSRYRSTTASTTATPKVSIKPNLFARRRPPTISLRSKIFNKYNKNNTDDKTTTTRDDEETTIPYDQNIEDSPTTKKIKEEVTEETETTTTDILKNESYIYSQRVSDLTSSSKNEYNTPGLFKSVSPTSRRIPPYFTIATDDPILPIEAFFPNIKDKPKE